MIFLNLCKLATISRMYIGKKKSLFVCLCAGTFEDSEITHVEGEVDPVRDLDIINEELRLKDEEYFSKVGAPAFQNKNP